MSNAYPREWVKSHLYPDRLLPNAHGYAHGYSYGYGNRHSNCDSYIHAKRDGCSDVYAYSHSHGHIYADSYSYGYANSNCHTYGHT